MRLKLSLLLVFIITHSWSQSGSTKTFTGNGTFPVPAGVTSIQVQAWGGGGSGGGASGAPLLLGRGAAGGGGGAYASNTLLVTPGVTLNVVVASQTAGTTAAGTAGGNSTITGFESSILAAGGSGGDANNAGGSPAGGAGGTIAASAGSVKFAGANGGNGNSWNLLGLLLSSGPGGAGAGSGGAGGTAVSGLLLSNAPGNAGSPPGGGGSGAINSALGASQIGGAGAAGRVIISYSCTNFSLTSTTASSICASSGTTSSITLTGSAASLPVGSYIVTYNRSSPSATGLTAALTVSTAGTGTFIATGLSAVGSSTITITKLTSESCSSDITSNNTAVVTISAATVGGTVSGGTTVNSGDTSGLLTLSGHTGSVIKWQSSVSPFTTWTDIANTTTTYTSGPLIETTQFRAVVQNGVFCAALNSASTTVTVNPRPTITLAASATSVCSSAVIQTSSLSYSSITGNPTTYSIVWDPSPANSFAEVIDGALPGSPFTLVIPPGTAAGTYTGTLTIKNASGAVSSPGSIFTVTVNPSPAITLSETNLSTCTFAGNGQIIGVSYSNATGNPTTYSIVWDSSPGNTIPSVTNRPLGGDMIEIFIPRIDAGTYTGTLTVKNADGCVSTGTAITLNVYPQPTIETTGTIDPVCSGAAQIASLAYTATSNNPTSYSINWDDESFPDQGITAFSFASGGGIINNIEIPANIPAGTYSGGIIVRNENCDIYQPISIVINPSPTITLTQSEFNVCDYNNSVLQTITILYSGSTGSPDTFSIVWNSSPENNLPEIIDEELSESAISFSVSHLTEGTYTGTLTVKNANGCVSSGLVITLNVLPRPTLTTTGVIDSVYSSNSPQSTSLTYSAATDNPTSYSIDWDDELFADQGATLFGFASSGGVINNIEVPANISPGTYLGTLFITNGTCDGSQPISIVISDPAPTIELSLAAETRCSYTDGSSSATTISYAETTGNPVSYSIVWDASPANDFAAVTDAALPASPITIPIPGGTIPGTYTGTLTVKNANGTVSSGSVFSLKLNETPTIDTEAVIAAVDASNNGQTTTLEYFGVTGNPVSYFIDWNFDANEASLEDQPVTPFAFSSSGGIIDNIQISANVPPGSYIGSLVIYNGICNQHVQVYLKVKSVSTTITLANSELRYCFDRTIDEVIELHYTTTGNPVTYSITWDEASSFTFNNVIDEELDGIQIDIPNNIPPESYSGTVTVKDAQGNVSSGAPFTIYASNTPIIFIYEPIEPVCSSTSSQLTTLFYSQVIGGIPERYHIDWDSAANTAGLIDQGATSQEFIDVGSAIEGIQIPANVPAGTYSGILYINTDSCEGSHPVSIVINEECSSRQVVSSKGPASQNNIPAGTTDLETAEKITSVTAFNEAINVETTNQTINQVFVFDIAGSLLYKKSGISDSKLVIDSLRSSNQVLVVKVVLNDNRVATKKVVY